MNEMINISVFLSKSTDLEMTYVDGSLHAVLLDEVDEVGVPEKWVAPGAGTGTGRGWAHPGQASFHHFLDNGVSFQRWRDCIDERRLSFRLGSADPIHFICGQSKQWRRLVITLDRANENSNQNQNADRNKLQPSQMVSQEFSNNNNNNNNNNNENRWW